MRFTMLGSRMLFTSLFFILPALCTAQERKGSLADLQPGNLRAVSKEKLLGDCRQMWSRRTAMTDDAVARFTIIEHFTNQFDKTITALYSAPILAGSTIDEITIYSGYHVSRLRIGSRNWVEDHPKSQYVSDLSKLSGSYDFSSTTPFTQSIGSIAPGEEVEIEVDYIAEPVTKIKPSYDATATEDISEMGLLQKIHPLVMYIYILLFFMMVYVCGFIVRRVFTFSLAKTQTRLIASNLPDCLTPDHLKEANTFLTNYSFSPLADVMRSVVTTAHDNFSHATILPELCSSARSRAMAQSDARLFKGLRGLQMIGWLAIMLGFLGTFIGIFDTVNGLRYAEGTGISAIAGGISEAFCVALFGLFIALPTLWAHRFFSTRARRIGLMINTASWQLLEQVLWQIREHEAARAQNIPLWIGC